MLAVQSKVILWDHRIPLRQKSKEDVKALWEEVIQELGVSMTVDEVKAKWKTIRDSYIRARNTYKKKIPSGASAKQREEAERILKKHRNYDLLRFLDDTLADRRTNTNLDESDSRPSTSHSYREDVTRTPVMNTEPQQSDTIFLEAMKDIASSVSSPATPQYSASQHFCLHLAERIDRLPRSVKTALQIQFLQLIDKAEAEHLTSL